jgi:hypothetical protein
VAVSHGASGRSLPVAVPGFVIVVRLHRLHSSENPWRLVEPAVSGAVVCFDCADIRDVLVRLGLFRRLDSIRVPRGAVVLAEITGSILPIRIRAILVFVAFVGSLVCADLAVHMGELG